jgi:ABC-type transport system substrate-binding protein
MAAKQEQEQLFEFEGSEVLRSAIAFKVSTDPLNDVVEVDGLFPQIGDRLFFVVGVDCTEVKFKVAKGNEDKLVRVWTALANEWAPVDIDVVQQVLDGTAQRVKAHKDAVRGTPSLFSGGSDGTPDA